MRRTGAARRPASLSEQACRTSRFSAAPRRLAAWLPSPSVTRHRSGPRAATAFGRLARRLAPSPVVINARTDFYSRNISHQSRRQRRRERSSRPTRSGAAKVKVRDACHEIARPGRLISRGHLIPLDAVVDGWRNRPSPGAPPTSRSPIRGDVSKASVGCAREHMDFAAKSRNVLFEAMVKSFTISRQGEAVRAR